MMNNQNGQSLPLAIIALAIGSLVVAPFLGLASTDLIGSRVYGEAIAEQSACEAGVEHAIWSLTRGDLAEQFVEPGDEVTYQLDETINGLTAVVTVTANVTGSGPGGDITDVVIDTLEFDSSNCYEPDIIYVADNVYAAVYRGPDNDGFLKTVSIDAAGEIDNNAIDTLEFDTSNGYEPRIIHVSGNVFVIVYRGTDSDGFLKTISINSDGEISSVIDTLEYDTANGYEPCIVHISENIYAIAYRGSGNDGFLKTVTITTGGSIGNSTINTMEFDTSNGYEPSMTYISGNIYAVAYRGVNDDGFLKTVTIDADGAIGNSAIDTLEFDITNGYDPGITSVADEIYAIVYNSTSGAGYLKTVSIEADGYISNSVVDGFIFDSPGYEPGIINVSDDIYAVAYRGTGNDGFLETITITSDGDIADSVTDTLRFDASSCYEPSIISTSGGIYAIAYRGSGNDGFIQTLGVSETDASAAYEIAASAGGRTIRAFVNTDNTTAAIVSWQIE